MSTDFHRKLTEQGRIPIGVLRSDEDNRRLREVLEHKLRLGLGNVEVRPAGVTYSLTVTRHFLAGLCAFFFVQGLVVGAAAVVLWQAFR
jgi:hypothetical protein